jgi:hypothetical protein
MRRRNTPAAQYFASVFYLSLLPFFLGGAAHAVIP